MKRIKETLSSLLVIILLIAFGAGIGVYGDRWYTAQKHEGIIHQSNEDLLQLPGETERYVITQDEIEARLREIREFASYSGIYEASRTEDVWRNLDDLSLPGTRNTVAVHCEGVVKAGYDVDLISVEVDAENETIYIKLPPVSVLDNYVIVDTVDTSGSVNNILHPLSFEQYRQVIVSVEEEGLKQVTEKGLFEHAKEASQNLIIQCLAGVTDYEVKFL